MKMVNWLIVALIVLGLPLDWFLRKLGVYKNPGGTKGAERCFWCGVWTVFLVVVGLFWIFK
jgi:hypothetical protein